MCVWYPESQYVMGQEYALYLFLFRIKLRRTFIRELLKGIFREIHEYVKMEVFKISDCKFIYLSISKLILIKVYLVFVLKIENTVGCTVWCLY